MLKALKRQYGSVYIAEFNDQLFIFREVTRAEYEELTVFFEDEYGSEEAVCRMAVLYPEDYDYKMRGRAGTAKLLSKEIIYHSKLDSGNQMHDALVDYRALMESNFHAQAEVYIATAFPHISFETMKHWTIEQFALHLARAEWALQTLHRIPINFQEQQPDPNEPPPREETLREIGDRMRAQGLDPMIELASVIRQKPPYTELPFIGGTKLLNNEEVLDRVREQVQKVSKQ